MDFIISHPAKIVTLTYTFCRLFEREKNKTDLV